MADQEFEESEVIFSDQDLDHDDNNNSAYYFSLQEMDMLAPSSRMSYNSRKSKKTKKPKKSSTVPVNIPIFQLADGVEFEDEYDGGELVPPHVIVGRRIAGKMAFSVCTGNGRTLKGRDLSQVRNSILRMTGFLET
ncbi:hypothetical protein K2173_006618 [Erythroxylum novogranatense]|uniref:Senescence regulator n=1 Tax=Erythroxylum novogranatense TaxID=1862640 RepID=A0AAV8T6L1_9ROSI|nr:hypothetical protein K2173_006618 [Erythroxylum novogranatense]